MALKSKQPPRAGNSRRKSAASLPAPVRLDRAEGGKTEAVGSLVETVEERLARKALVADERLPASESLGSMSREQRDKLLYGD